MLSVVGLKCASWATTYFIYTFTIIMVYYVFVDINLNKA